VAVLLNSRFGAIRDMNVGYSAAFPAVDNGRRYITFRCEIGINAFGM
jgi:hypothetical protein